MDRESNQAGTEQQLVARAVEGDWEAFEALVTLHERRIYHIAFRILANTQDAEDVLQETFLKAIEHLEQFRQESSFFTWIVRIAFNTSLQLVHKSHSMGPLEEYSNKSEHFLTREIAISGETTEHIFSRLEVQQILNRAIAALPVIYRTVFLLKDVDNLPVEQIASLLRITPPAVKSLLIRARSELREYLSKHF
jgi:RNA polymerase sigma-70 factor, ECF subfamily